MKTVSRKFMLNYFTGLTFILPLVIIYLIVFAYSMHSALDRDNYIFIMEHPFSGREEPLIHIISYVLSFLFTNPIYKLIFLQLSIVGLLCISLIKSSQVYNLSGLTKALVLIFLFFSVFSNMLVVQLRIGYAVVIFIALLYLFNKRPNIRNIPFFLLPCLMHTGLIPAVVIYYIFIWFKIDSFKKFSIALSGSIIGSTLLFKYVTNILTALNINGYYFLYFDEDTDFGRALPFSVVFYLLLSIPSIYVYRKKSNSDPNFWFGNFGLLLVYTGLILKFYISFKMLVPFSAFLYIYTINNVLPITSYSAKLYLICIITIMPLCYLMLSNQAGLI